MLIHPLLQVKHIGRLREVPNFGMHTEFRYLTQHAHKATKLLQKISKFSKKYRMVFII
jgi:hypothetical protein